MPAATSPTDPAPPTDRVLHRSAHCTVGLFDLPPGHALWRTENRIERGPLIAIPWTAVVIDRAGARHELMDANRVAFYRRGQAYERRAISPRGDRCAFIVPSDRLLRDALAAAAAPAGCDAYPFATGPAVSAATRAQHSLIRVLLSSTPPTAVEVDDAVTHVVDLLVTEAARESGRRPARTRHASCAHRELAEAARAAMNARLENHEADASLSITELADEVDASPHHLCRVFRAAMGDSLARHYRRLRLRVAAEAVAASDTPLTDVALRFGFSSHAHFSAAWRGEFGCAPSELRKARI